MSAIEDVYALARRHGLSHEKALDAVAAGEVRCWCGAKDPCPGGAQRFIGCPHMIGGEGAGWGDAPIPLNFTHRKHRGDMA